MALTEITIKNAKPKERVYKLTDGGGMYLLITPKGQKYWRMKYYTKSKERVAALGVYPEVSLIDARARQAKLKQDIKLGIDIIKVKKEEKLKQQNKYSFETIALEWHKNKKSSLSSKYAKNIITKLERYIFLKLGHKDIRDIPPPELLEVLRKVEDSGALNLAHKILQICGQIFRYAIVTGRVQRDISADLRGALKTTKTTSYSKLKTEELPEFLNKLEGYQGEVQTKLAIKLLILTFVRTGELRGAKWEEFKLDKEEWHIPAERMKMQEKHIVPLSRQAIEVIEELKKISRGDRYLFPNVQNPQGYMGENTMLHALYRTGYHKKATIHGFRSLASTILNEHNFPTDAIERQLAHSERNGVRASYNYAQYLPERKKMMQWWADYLDGVRKGA